MAKIEILGIDTGNYATKTEHTSLPSGFLKTKDIPTISGGQYMKYKGQIYVPSDTARVEYIRDKTVDDTHFLLTLLGIGSELYYRIGKQPKGDLQKAADEIEEVYVAVGLPPAHHASLASAYKEYFIRHFGETTEFIYNGIHFSFRVPVVRVLAQDYTAVMEYNAKSKYAKMENGRFMISQFYAVDIGGKTVDYVEIRDGKAVSFDSVNDGILTMFNTIEKNLRRDGYTADDILCEKILRRDPIRTEPEVQEAVIRQAGEWTDKILRAMNNNINLRSAPVVFIGGGSRLLRPFIKESPLLREFEFLGSASANAVAYGKYMRDLYRSGGLQ